MYAVGRIGSYISRGVYTVSAPFHPFGGAVDIIVVEQPDGSFKSSPWYVRFGKFQGVLKTKEKVVTVNVNGVEADFHMYLDHKGEAYFLGEVDAEEGESVLLYPSSSGDETEWGTSDSGSRRTMKSKSCNFDAALINPTDQIGSSNGKILTRSGSRRGRILGLVFGRRSIKGYGNKNGEGSNVDIARVTSLERAEIAADLLEVKWSTNLSSSRIRKDVIASKISSKGTSDDNIAQDVQVHDEQTRADSSVCDDGKSRNDCSMLHKEIGLDNEQVAAASQSNSKDMKDAVEEIVSVNNGTVVEEKCDMVSETRKSDDFGVVNGGHDEYGDGISAGSQTSGSSVVGLNGLKGQVQETVSVATEPCVEVHIRVETLHVTTELPSEDPGKNIEVEKAIVDLFPSEVSQNHSVQTSSSEPAPCSAEVVESHIIDIIPERKSTTVGLNQSLESIGNAQKLNKTASDSLSGSSEEEQFLFSDLDESKLSEVRHMDSSSPDFLEKDSHQAICAEGTKDDLFSPSPDMIIKSNESTEVDNYPEMPRVISTPIAISRIQKNGEDVGRFAESLPNMWSPTVRMGVLDHPLSHSMHLNAKPSNRTLLNKNESSNIDSDTDKEQQLSKKTSNMDDTCSSVGDSSKTSVPSGGSWSLWPFSSSRSRSHKATQLVPSDTQSSATENALGSMSMKEPNTELASISTDKTRPDTENATGSINSADGAKVVGKAVAGKKMVRSIIPTSEQLVSLNLKEGRNIVTFTFSTGMLGKQQVDANIYLWKWNTRIVISDVDGTITKSDVLGQFMPLVGMDWSQTGVAHLFSAIKENGYQLLFLSARAIAQAYHTRRFLFNLKQDGQALPDGPVVISPDGLFPSLFREVIRRAPHEFKISCLEEIRALFPSDCNPFYAGFGNRDTDELSYLKVGIPRGKIFTINPKGEIAVNQRIDTKSYSSLHSLVHGMFPPTTTTSSEQEDYNSWNFWKLPPPEIKF